MAAMKADAAATPINLNEIPIIRPLDGYLELAI